MSDGAMGGEQPEATGRVYLEARRTRVEIVAWRVALKVADLLGKAGRVALVDGRAITALLVLLAPTLVFAHRHERERAFVAGGLWLGVMLLLVARDARRRFIVGEFKHSSVTLDGSTSAAAPSADLANLLLVEISQLGDLFKVVGDRRAVASEFGPGPALDSTISVDDLASTLQGTISAEAKAKVGPVEFPLAPLVALFGKVLQAPRLTGNFHRDGGTLILTAQTRRRANLSWRVERTTGLPSNGELPPDDPEEAVVSGMVQELALRIYTDLALGRAVRWQASKSFVDGLRRFRSCLRTPKDRKVNLKRTEDLFLKALAEDEDFPLVYYNLGVVYTELHGLAVAAGRTTEAKMRLSAAETSFGRAIEKEAGRWECSFAFAQTQFRYERYDSVVDLCSHILTLSPTRAEQAKTRELLARALRTRAKEPGGCPDDIRTAIVEARRASRKALDSLLRARLLRGPSSRGEDDPERRCAGLAASCLLTFSDIYSEQMPRVDDLSTSRVRRWHQLRIRRRAQALAKLAPLPHGKARLRFDFGMRLLAAGHTTLAEQELEVAAGSDPTRPSYSAGLALARATCGTQKGPLSTGQRNEVEQLCLRALQGMAGAFFPSRDAEACGIVADVFERLGDEAHQDMRTATELRKVAKTVEAKLANAVGGGSVSGAFLDALESAPSFVSSRVGVYGKAAQEARALLQCGRLWIERGEREEALDAFRQALGAAERATSLNPLSTMAWETLGDIHREFLDFHNARACWVTALGTDPDNPRLYDKIGSSYWQIAFQGRSRTSEADLRKAAEYFTIALRLYGSGSYNEQMLTHYRLGKLSAALGEFGEARRHLEIVAAVGPPPIVGWQLLGFAYLRERNFSESEFYFGRVIMAGRALGAELSPDKVVGERLDEQFWPLALVRAWGHLALAITLAERDGDLTKAQQNVEHASELLCALDLDPSDPASDERFPTRILAAMAECRGLILLRAGAVGDAIPVLEEAVSAFPHSRAYLSLAEALEQRALADTSLRQRDVGRALRLLEHAISLGPTQAPSSEVQRAQDRLLALWGSENGTSA